MYRLIDDVEKYDRARQIADGNLIQRGKDAICILYN